MAGRKKKRRRRFIRREQEAILVAANLSKEPFTAEQQALLWPHPPSKKVLVAIYRLKKLILLDAFGHDERFFPGGKQ